MRNYREYIKYENRKQSIEEVHRTDIKRFIEEIETILAYIEYSNSDVVVIDPDNYQEMLGFVEDEVVGEILNKYFFDVKQTCIDLDDVQEGISKIVYAINTERTGTTHRVNEWEAQL